MSKLSKFFKNVNKKPWFKTFKAVAPELAAGVIGGPLAPLAMTILRKTLGNDDLDEQSLEAAITSGDPLVYAQMQEANKLFLIEMERLGIEREKLRIEEQGLFLEDVQSARQMQIATMDDTPKNLTYLAAVLLLSIIGVMIWQKDWLSANEFAQNFAYLLVGSSLGWVTQAFNFWLGSSRGSYAKTQAMQGMLAKGGMNA